MRYLNEQNKFIQEEKLNVKWLEPAVSVERDTIFYWKLKRYSYHSSRSMKYEFHRRQTHYSINYGSISTHDVYRMHWFQIETVTQQNTSWSTYF